MNIFLYLFEKFFYTQKWYIASLLIVALLMSFVYTKISSRVNANIIQSINKEDLPKAFTYFWYFIGISIVFLATLYIFKWLQNVLLTNLSNWVKKELFAFILKSNYENMKNRNFADFITPITRISSASTSLLNDIITNLIPTLGFLVVITAYFCYMNWGLGIGFLVSNIILFSYLFFCWKSMFKYKQQQETMVVGNERYILDNLNNLDKIIYRGTMEKELGIFEKKTEECIDYSIKMNQYMMNHMFIMNIGIYIVMFSCMYGMLHLHSKKKLDALTLITFLTILIMYRDNISDTVQSIPHNTDLFGRIDLVLREFNEMIDYENVKDVMNRQDEYETANLTFDTIEFRDVGFKYPTVDEPVFTGYSKELDLENKIIGVTGVSGKGKSTFVKLLLRLYDPSEGKIFIDGHDIRKIDPTYLRENITYVNQNSRLFDREVLENILYGCKDVEKCQGNLKEILAYSKIQELYKNVQFDSSAGPLGENLSGGQRQVANLISGLINPTKILVLDEPTNALDPNLKREVLSMIQHFHSYKKCIIIITHDRDVYPLFDETLEI
jgi:ABC-type multidrug transport system fused ATPase/permease subunit